MSAKVKILIIEDEFITRQAIKYILGKEDRYQVIGEASNGEEAKSMVEELKPDIVITDIVMPIVNGIELTKYIKVRYPDMPIIVLSSHSDFDYVKASFQYGVFEYILKPELQPQNLLEILNRACGSLNIEESEEEKKAKDIKSVDVFKQKDINKPYYYLLGCNLKKIKGYTPDKNKIYIDEISKEMSGLKESKLCYIRVRTNGTLFMIMNTGYRLCDNILKEVYESIKRIVECIPTLSFAMTEVFKEHSQLNDLKEELTCLLDQQFYYEEGPLIPPTVKNKSLNEVVFNHKEYRKNIEYGRYIEAFESIRIYLEQVSIAESPKEEELKKLVENIFYNTYNILEELGYEIPDISFKKIEALKKISEASKMSELKQCSNALLDEVEDRLKGQKEDSKRITQIYQYINEHYDEAITLNHLAKAFHMNYSYLSSYFSNEAHKGFNEYLNDVRIAKAKDFLLGSELSIADVSQKIGYTDQSYFSRVFKKATGYSPMQYRRKYLK